MLERIRSWSSFNKAGYMPLSGTSALSPSHRVSLYIKIATTVFIIVTLVVVLHPLSAAERYGLLHYQLGSIPSIVHYVYIKNDADSVLNFSFAQFLSIYASFIYIKPSKIYIHTDYNTTEISKAGKEGGMWTRKLINTFNETLEWNAVRIPEFAGAMGNVKIDAIQHKSDFIRWEQIAEKGGIYMDWDVVTLRPLTPLLNSGFAFIAGRQYGNEHEGGKINGTINNGVFLTRPKSAMAKIMLREQTSGFNGEWEYNLQFMTRVAEHLVSIPGEVLICDRHAFAPTHWFSESKESLFLPYEGSPSPEPVKTNSTDVLDIYDAIIKTRRERTEWEMDFDATYLLHAFGQGQHNEFITPKKILARRSNYGVATYDAVKKMVMGGVVNGTEDFWE